MTFTRRTLLEQIAKSAGTAGAYFAMETLGLAIPTPVGAENFALPPRSGNGMSVVILGAGIAGLVSAFELQRAGFAVTLLEARDRIGGRSWTIRNGDRIAQNDRAEQLATFDPSLYFNAGPARIPSTHRIILNYARRFGVKLEPFINVNRNARWDFSGKIYPERRMVEDLRGQLAELLAKAIDMRALDQHVSKDELAAVRKFLVPYASLGDDGRYISTGHSGYLREGGGYKQSPIPLPSLGLPELLPSEAIGLPYMFEHIWDMQATMVQPVGGMDRIARAIYEQVKNCVRLNRRVLAIRRIGDRVRIEHGPEPTISEADYCVCTLPLPVLARIPSDFSQAKLAAIRVPSYLHSVKVGFQSPKFWETDDNIFGGLAWTDRQNENVIYPSEGIGSSHGILVAGYCAGWTRSDNPDAFEALTHDERFRICRDSIEALHPNRSHLLSRGVTVAWGLTPYSEGAGALWGDPDYGGKLDRGAVYDELLKPEGPIVFAGEHLSYQPTWQEGAASSAHEAINLVAAMATGRHAHFAAA